MNILIVASYTVPEFAGGGQNAWQFACYLNSIGTNHLLLTLNRNLKWKGKETIGNVKIRRLPYFNANAVTKILSLVFLIWPGYLLQVLRSDFVYLIGANIVGYHGFIWLGSLLGKKVIFRSSLSGFDDVNALVKRSIFLGKFQRMTLSRIYAYISINPLFTKLYNESGIELKNLIESSQGVNINLFRPVSDTAKNILRQKYSIPSEKFVVLSVGYVIERKGFNDIFNFLANIESDFLYIVAGEISYPAGHFLFTHSEETNKLTEKGRSMLGDKLKLLGPVENPAEIYQLADIFLLGSETEGTPNVLLEAMASGLPVLCRHLEGLGGYLIFNGENGYLFNDYDSFLNGFRLLYSNSDNCHRLGGYSRKIIEKDHSFEKFYENVFLNEKKQA